MKRISMAVCSLALLAAACGKGAKDDKGSGSAATGSGSAAPTAGSTATGSGSAAGSAATGSAAATPPPAAPADYKITGKRAGGDIGPFEGDKGIYLKKGEDRMVLIPMNCPTFDCSIVDKNAPDREPINFAKLRKDCPSLQWIRVMLNDSNQAGEPKVGKTKLQLQAGGFSAGGDITGEWTDGGELTEVTNEVIAGTMDITSGEDKAKGAFKAKVCP